ncbi:hypothetical protein F4780DRAFT_725576 [Xylariomycetidae sp. FL0641]|nr:hypothetical protein F4780DRAFT_725576 [Xylariomycetidae sp. FL0641]
MSTVLRALWRRPLPHAPASPLAPARAHARIRPTQRPRTARRWNTDKPTPSSSSSPSPPPSPSSAQTARAHTILGRAQRFVPRRFHGAFGALRSAPLSHVAAFLVLHELTAILPLVGLAWAFHRADAVPTAWVAGPWAAWAEEGLRAYMGYFRRKGWFGLSPRDDDGEGEGRLEDELREEVRREKAREEGRDGKTGWMARFTRKGEEAAADQTESAVTAAEDDGKGKVSAAWQTVKKVVTVENTDKGYKIGIQIAAAYTITKMLLVPRIALSLWMTPWLARGMVSFRRKIFRRSK